MSKSRYEQEIEEILSKYDEEKSQKDKLPGEIKAPREFRPVQPIPPRKPPVPNRPTPDLKRLSSGQYMLAAFGVAILAVLMRPVLPPAITSLMVILAAVLFLVPILLNYTRGTGSSGSSYPREEKRWRGQVIDFNTRRDVTNDPLAGVKRWLKRK